MVQKSGCSHTSSTINHNININGTYQCLKLDRFHLYFLKKNAKNSINASFKNSVGWIVKGIPGIFIHHLAPFILIHINSTTISKKIANQKIFFTCFSKNW
jgi:hypothetical protein